MGLFKVADYKSIVKISIFKMVDLISCGRSLFWEPGSISKVWKSSLIPFFRFYDEAGVKNVLFSLA